MEENLGAAQVVLSSEDMATIETAFSKMKVAGARLPEALLQFSYR